MFFVAHQKKKKNKYFDKAVFLMDEKEENSIIEKFTSLRGFSMMFITH
jgi:hypothetical protein